MDQIGDICRCHCHSTFLSPEPEWDCYCNCGTVNKKPRKFPHKCPICDGQGGFYISGTMDSKCESCEKGIVWG